MGAREIEKAGPELISKHYGCSDGIKNKIGNSDGGKWKVGVCCG